MLVSDAACESSNALQAGSTGASMPIHCGNWECQCSTLRWVASHAHISLSGLVPHYHGNSLGLQTMLSPLMASISCPPAAGMQEKLTLLYFTMLLWLAWASGAQPSTQGSCMNLAPH